MRRMRERERERVCYAFLEKRDLELMFMLNKFNKAVIRG